MDKELTSNFDVNLFRSNLKRYNAEPMVASHGGIVLVKQGQVDLQLNFKQWHLDKDSVMIIFPGDVLQVSASPDFSAELLTYDAAMLRQASLEIEHTVYSQLRLDRCQGNKSTVSAIVGHMFGFLHVFFDQGQCTCLDQLVYHQLKAFFLGFYDFMIRHPQERPVEGMSRRVNELFNSFMELVTENYKQSRDVMFYAEKLNITPKYLSLIVSKKTRHNPKTIIDHYVVMQLKMLLRTSHDSIKQIAWLFNFNDSSFFCRYFKMHTGLTPQQYRKLETKE